MVTHDARVTAPGPFTASIASRQSRTRRRFPGPGFRQHLVGAGYASPSGALARLRDSRPMGRACARVATPLNCLTMREQAARHPQRAAAIFARALAVRELIWQIGGALAGRGEIAQALRDELVEVHARSLAFAENQIARSGVHLGLGPAPRPRGGHSRPDHAVGLVALDGNGSLAHQAMRGQGMRLALLRCDQEQEPALVRDEGVRQPRQGARRPSAQKDI